MTGDESPSRRVLYVASTSQRDDPAYDALVACQGVTVVTAETPKTGLTRLADGNVDCVVSRYRFSDGDGLAFLEAVRTRWPKLPFVLVPEEGSDDLASRAIAADVTEYVPLATVGDGRLVTRVAAATEIRPANPNAATSSMSIDGLDFVEEYQLKERAMDAAPVGITISDATLPDNPLIYLNDAFERLTGYSKAATVGQNCRFLQGDESDPEAIAAMRKAVETEESVSVELVNYRRDGTKFWNRVDIAPLRDEDGEVTNFVGFQTDITARKTAELQLARERERLERLVQRINGLIQDVTQELVSAQNRSDIEQAVCERLVDVDTYTFGVVCEQRLQRDAVVPRAWAGSVEVTDDPLGHDADDDPIREAIRTRQTRVVRETATVESLTDAYAWASREPIEGVVVVPLVYHETLYGALVVATTDRDALDGREVVVLEALARMTATAINAIERGRILVADNVVELRFEVRDSTLFFVGLSEQLACQLEYNGSVTDGDESLVMFFTTDGDTDELVDAAREYADVEAVTVVHEGDDSSLLEFTVSDGSIVTRLAQRGAQTTSIRVERGVGTVDVELPAETDTRAVVEQFVDRYPGTELVAHREVDRPPQTKQEFISDATARLTERQLVALRKAYIGGFYDNSRGISGEELADSMDISRVTYHQHRRAAERKLLAEFFEE